MEGVVELAEEVFHLPVRVGLPQHVTGLTDVVGNPIHATGVGLLLAHWLASKITSNFALSQLKTAEGLKMLSAQVAGGLAVTIVAVIPLLLFPTVSGVWASAGLLVAFVCAVSYYAARANQRSRPAAFAYVLAIVVIATGIVILKTAVEH